VKVKNTLCTHFRHNLYTSNPVPSVSNRML